MTVLALRRATELECEQYGKKPGGDGKYRSFSYCLCTSCEENFVTRSDHVKSIRNCKKCSDKISSSNRIKKLQPKYGDWEVLHRSTQEELDSVGILRKSDGNHRPHAYCLCTKCNETKKHVRIDGLEKGSSSQCDTCRLDMYSSEYSKHPLWASLLKHKYWCENKKSKSYINYGAKGRYIDKNIRFTDCTQTNEKIFLNVLKVIGDKPKKKVNGKDVYDECFHLHVDWEKSPCMSLDNISWLERGVNAFEKERTCKIPGTNQKISHQLCNEYDLERRTVTSRAAKGQQDIFGNLFNNYRDLKPLFEMIKSGQIFSFNGEIYKVTNAISARKIPSQLNKSGYLSVGIKINGKQFASVQVSRLVLLEHAGLPPEPSNKCVFQAEHCDANKLNNSVSNLIWLSHKINIAKKATVLSNYQVEIYCKKGLAIKPSTSISPFDDHKKQMLINYAKTSLNNQKLYGFKSPVPLLFSNFGNIKNKLKIDIDIARRILISPSNKAQWSSLERDYEVFCAKGNKYKLCDVSKSMDVSFHISFYAYELINLSNSNRYVKELFSSNSITHSMYIEDPKVLGMRVKKNSRDKNIDYILNSGYHKIPSSIVITHPDNFHQYIQNEDGNRLNPLLISQGSSEFKGFFLCTSCESKVAEVPLTPKKFFSKDVNNRDFRGVLCADCRAEIKANNLPQ